MNANRNGNFTSSQIECLLSEPTAKALKEGAIFGAPALTYIKEKNFERKLNRSISTESNARPLTWGKLLEKRVFELLGIAYQECSQESIQHPSIPYWWGSPDGIKHDEGKTVMDIKCPQTLKSFCELVECKTIEDVRANHKEGDTYYYQLVSNAILTGSKFAELIIYCPYYSELTEVRELATKEYEHGNSAYYWIAKSTDEEIPFLLESGEYNNINIIRWEVLESDKVALTTRVMEAGKLLIEKRES